MLLYWLLSRDCFGILETSSVSFTCHQIVDRAGQSKYEISLLSFFWNWVPHTIISIASLNSNMLFHLLHFSHHSQIPRVRLRSLHSFCQHAHSDYHLHVMLPTFHEPSLSRGRCGTSRVQLPSLVELLTTTFPPFSQSCVLARGHWDPHRKLRAVSCPFL